MVSSYFLSQSMLACVRSMACLRAFSLVPASERSKNAFICKQFNEIRNIFCATFLIFFLHSQVNLDNQSNDSTFSSTSLILNLPAIIFSHKFRASCLTIVQGKKFLQSIITLIQRLLDIIVFFLTISMYYQVQRSGEKIVIN